MLNFGDNFRAGKDKIDCPLCNQHSDSQFELLNCFAIRQEFDKKGASIPNVDLDELFSENVGETAVKVLKTAMEFRQNLLN